MKATIHPHMHTLSNGVNWVSQYINIPIVVVTQPTFDPTQFKRLRKLPWCLCHESEKLYMPNGWVCRAMTAVELKKNK